MKLCCCIYPQSGIINEKKTGYYKHRDCIRIEIMRFTHKNQLIINYNQPSPVPSPVPVKSHSNVINLLLFFIPFNC